VTLAENIRRARRTGFAKIAAETTHCPKGHEYAKHGVIYRNGFSNNGSIKFARRCTLCNPKYLNYTS
jgi:hypothetical protein